MFRRYRIIHQYIAKEFILSFLIAFSFLFFCFFVNQILLIAQASFAKNIPLPTILQLLIYNIPQILSLTFPYSALVGAFMGIGRLSAENEILGMLVSGIPRVQMLTPLLIIGLFIGIFSYFTNDVLLPLGNLKYREIRSELVSSQAEVELAPYSVNNNDEQTIVTTDIKDSIFEDILIFDRDDENNQRIILADYSSVIPLGNNNGGISIVMNNVFLLSPTDQKINTYNYQKAEEMRYNIPLAKITKDLLNPGPRELPVSSVQKHLKELRTAQNKQNNILFKDLKYSYAKLDNLYQKNIKTNDPSFDQLSNILALVKKKSYKHGITRNYRNWSLELFQKFTLPIITLPFVLLAFSLGLMTRRNGKSIGFLTGTLFCILHWCMLIVSRIIGFKFFNISLPLIMWTPVFFYLILAIFWFMKPATDYIKLKKAQKNETKNI